MEAIEFIDTLGGRDAVLKVLKDGVIEGVMRSFGVMSNCDYSRQKDVLNAVKQGVKEAMMEEGVWK